MALISADRVRDTTTTSGTGAITVSGTAPTNYRTFSAVCSTNDTFTYFIASQTLAEWEVGLGTYSAANQITRTTVYASSNANAAVNFTAATTKDVVLTPTAELIVAKQFSNVEDRIKFFPSDNEPPTSNYATLDTRNGHPTLDFDDTTQEGAVFTGVLWRSYGGGGVTVETAYAATSATSGTVGWTIEFERIGDSQLDTDSDNFASAQTITATTVPATSGFVTVQSLGISNGANMASIAAGEQFRIRIKRDVANDTAVGDAELNWLSIRAT